MKNTIVLLDDMAKASPFNLYFEIDSENITSEIERDYDIHLTCFQREINRYLTRVEGSKRARVAAQILYVTRQDSKKGN